MAVDLDVNLDNITNGIVRSIERSAQLEHENNLFKRALLMQAVKQRRELEIKKQEKQIMTPFEMIMAKQYSEQHPEVDFSGIPGFPARTTSPVATPEPVMSLIGGGQGDINGNPINQPAMPQPQSVSQGDVFSEKPTPSVEIGKSGFTQKTPSTKEFIYQRIQEKKNAGQSLTLKEQQFERKYLGIDDDKKELKPEDMMRLRTLAKEMATNAGEYQTTEEVIAKYIPQAKNYLYPNAKTDETKPLDITLPGHIKDSLSALKYLTEQGMSEMEARDWLKARMRKR